MRVVVVVVAAVVAVAGAHDWGMGTCPRPTPDPDLDVSKFLGLWYVISQVDTTSTCLTMNFRQVSETQLKAEKSRQVLWLDSLKIKHLNNYTATIDIPDGNNPAKMRIKWPLNVAGKADFTVMDTDYTTYALIYECQQLSLLFHRKSAAILSRDITINEAEKQRLLQILEGAGIDLADMDAINHSSCIEKSEAAVNINIDEETIKKMMSDASTNIRTVVKQVADGAGDLANTVADLARRLASQESRPGSGDAVDLTEVEVLE